MSSALQKARERLAAKAAAQEEAQSASAPVTAAPPSATETESSAPAAPPAPPAAAVASTAAAPAATAPSTPQRSPSDFLKTVLGRPVVVKLNSGVEYRGVLACLDGFMNIAMEQTEEYESGQLKNKYGDCFIRGNNVLYISAQRK